MNGKYIVYLPSVYSRGANDSSSQPWANWSLVSPNRSRQGSGHEDPYVIWLRNFFEIWLCPPMAILGILGNLVSLGVLFQMRKSKLRGVTTMLQALAVSDTVVLLSGFLLRSMRYLAGDWYVPIFTVMFPILFATTYVLRLINTWLTVLLTFDRYVAVCYPLHAQRLCTAKKTYVQIACVVIFSFTFCIPRYFESKIAYTPGNPNPQYKTTWLMDDRLYAVVYRIILFLFIQYILPMIILIALNGRVVWCLRASSTHQEFNHRFKETSTSRSLLRDSCMTNDQSAGSANSTTNGASTRLVSTVVDDNLARPVQMNSNEEPIKPPARKSAGKTTHSASTRAVTRIVVAIVLLCTVCHIVAMVSQILWSVQAAFYENATLDLTRRLFSNFTNLIMTFNSAVNFLIYCALSRNFRAILDRSLTGVCRRGRQWHLNCCRHGQCRQDSSRCRSTMENGTGNGKGWNGKSRSLSTGHSMNDIS